MQPWRLARLDPQVGPHLKINFNHLNSDEIPSFSWINQSDYSGMFFSSQHRSVMGGDSGTGFAHSTPSHTQQSSFRIGSGGGASRRTALLQRAIGRAFYAWGVQLGTRLQKQIDEETEEAKKALGAAEKRQRKLQDELEDFLDDGSVNDPKGPGDQIPPALQLMVCALLQQITAFLRETFQTLPRAHHSQKSGAMSAANVSGWERLQVRCTVKTVKVWDMDRR